MRCSLLTLSGYLDGELEPARRGEIDGHLAGCDRCRNALGYLKEEAERINGLARVRVPDEAVHAFMAQLGLIGPNDVLAPRAARGPVAVASGTPPWLTARAVGTSLPWAPRRDAESAEPDPNQPSLPFMAELPVHELTQLPPSRGRLPRSPSEEAEMNLSGRSSLASPVPRIPFVTTAQTAASVGTRMEPAMPAPGQPALPATSATDDELPAGATLVDAASAGTSVLDGGGDLLTAPAPPAPGPLDLDEPPVDQSSEHPDSREPGGPLSSAPLDGMDAEEDSWMIGRVEDEPTPPPFETPQDPPVPSSPPPAASEPAPIAAWMAGAFPEAAAPGAPPASPLASSWPDAAPAAPVPPDEEPTAPVPPAWGGHIGHATVDDDLTPPADPGLPASTGWREEGHVPSTAAFPWTVSSQPADPDARQAQPPDDDSGARPDPDEDLWSWAPRGDSPDAPALGSDPSDDSIPKQLPPPPPPFDPSWTSERTGRAANWASLASMSDADNGADPLMARATRPTRPSPPSPISWLRDKIALRLALMRTPHSDDELGIVSGPGNQRQAPPEQSSAGSPRPDSPPSGATWQHPVESAGPITATAHAWSVPAAEAETPIRSWPRGHDAITAEELNAPGEGFIVPVAVGDLAGERGNPGRHARSLARHGRNGGSDGTFPRLVERLSGARVQARRALAHPNRWWALAAAAALVVVLLAVFIPLSGAKPASSPLPRPTPTTVPSVRATAQPTSTPAPTIAPTVAPAPAAYIPPAPLTIGGGGAGWQLAGLQYGQHANYMSVVLTLTPASQGAAGEPAAVISAPASQTMVVTLTGVKLSSSAGTLSGSGVVTGVGVTTSGNQTALRFALTRAVTIQSAGYVLPTSQGSALVFYLNLG